MNSAGNSAERHWKGTFVDSDADGWHNFAGSDESNAFQGNSGNQVSIYLSWDDWSKSSQDYDLYLYRGNETTSVASSKTQQTGTQRPTERISLTLPSTAIYHVVIRKVSATHNVNFDLFVHSRTLQYQVPAGSLTIPADSQDVLAVGATHWNSDALEPYSSRGPTTDGRVKPDISAPACVSTLTNNSFCGTSASAPHVAGAAALVKQANPSFSPAQTRAFLESYALDYGPAGKDNLYGSGRLNLPTPSTTTNKPPAGSVWYLAEGYTGPGFYTFILIQNPNSTSTTVQVTRSEEHTSELQSH